MIERIDGAHTAAGGFRAVRSTTAARSSFAGELERFAEAKTPSKSKPGAGSEDGAVRAVARPDGEQTRKVAGHPYARVLNGDDRGMYLNQLESSPRKGAVFKLVERDERTFHVYGAGADRLIVEVKKKAATDTTNPAAATNPTATTPKTTGGAAPTAGY